MNKKYLLIIDVIRGIDASATLEKP